MTNGGTPDGQAGRGCPSIAARFVYKGSGFQATEGEAVRYALVIYANTDVRDRTPEDERRRIAAGVYGVLQRPDVTGWVRLQEAESATTVRYDQGRTLLTDGPFVDSKDYLGGFIVVEAENLDGALAVAGELQELRGGAGAIEIRPVLHDDPRRA
jgi:hypothetical protein